MPLSHVQTLVRRKGPTPPQLHSLLLAARDHQTKSSKMPEMVFKMEMTCEGCATAARKVLGKMGEKVTKVDTDIQNQTVTVVTTSTEEEILEALKKTGKTVAFVKKA